MTGPQIFGVKPSRISPSASVRAVANIAASCTVQIVTSHLDDLLRGGPRHRDDPDVDPLAAHRGRQRVEVRDVTGANWRPNQVRIDIEPATNRKPCGAKPS